MARHCFIFVFVLLTVYAGTAAENPATPVYEFKLQKADDSIVVQTGDKHTFFVVTSASGIGNATITLMAGQWPKHIALRFQYPQGREFALLEGFSIATAHLQVQDKAQPGQTKMPFHLLDGEGKADAADAPAGELNVVVERRDGALEITLPSNIFAGSKEVKFGWIDFYR